MHEFNVYICYVIGKFVCSGTKMIQSDIVPTQQLMVDIGETIHCLKDFGNALYSRA
jgi:hypothetical protein